MRHFHWPYKNKKDPEKNFEKSYANNLDKINKFLESQMIKVYLIRNKNF